MASIDDLILTKGNPFDKIKAVDFWQECHESFVASIHEEAIAAVEEELARVAKIRSTRTLLLDGDIGMGKSRFLSRISQQFRSQAFFVYINPFTKSDRIWRHILRCTVNSFLQRSDRFSQLMLWFNSLHTFKHRSFWERVLQDNFWDLPRSERQRFIEKVSITYEKLCIYKPSDFFGALYDFKQPKLRSLVCSWLRGDDLTAENLKLLGITGAIDTEDAAQEILANFGKLSTYTRPIVLCFDQLENIARLPDNSIDLPALFKVNTNLRSKGWQNFLIIISITTDTWKQNANRIEQSDQARIDREIHLKPITLAQAEALWAEQLYFIHKQANPRPTSRIYPLTSQWLEKEFPGGKASPRNVLLLGRQLIQSYKDGKSAQGSSQENYDNEQEKILIAFKLLWNMFLKQTQQEVIHIHHLSPIQLIPMLQEVLAAFQVDKIRTSLLTQAKFDGYAISYQLPKSHASVGVVWMEDKNMTTFFQLMEDCKQVIEQDLCEILVLIRFEEVGKSYNKGYQIYTENFPSHLNCHIKPALISIQYLVTYFNLVKKARDGDLIIEGKNINLRAIQALVRQSNILGNCPLLKDLAIVEFTKEKISESDNLDYHQQLKESLFNLVSIKKSMGGQRIIENIGIQFPQVSKHHIEQVIQELCQEGQIQIYNKKVDLEEQLIYILPKARQ